ncbi:terminase small subunit [Sporomusa sp.]|uniref:terminase small subunit n=1 Tax=Sporomusa sp. TaxID=2078658 RepID=UPI002CA89C3F|nr:terminase small subunit [Sporomusa sp.]HWR07113.1 terminase small subunit [Sporomusa sp.]
MAKKPHELALNDYVLGMSYKDIADKYKVGVDTVKKWKTRYKWNRDSVPKPKKTVSTLSTKNEKVDKSGQQQEADPELTDTEQLFCYHFVKDRNATQAALKSGYSKHKPSAAVMGCRLLQRPRVKAEIDRLRGLVCQDLHIGLQDFLQFCVNIVSADIGDYVGWGQRQQQVIGMYGPLVDKKTKQPIMETINFVDLGESELLDTSVIQEVKQGKDGISIKLADKKWAWEQLIKFFDWLPDKWQRNVEEEKLKLAKAKLLLEVEKAKGENKENQHVDALKRKMAERKMKNGGA